MNSKEINKAKRRLNTLARQLAAIGPVMRGSIVKTGTRNKQYYFSLNKDKKTHLVYLGSKRVGLARKYSTNYRKIIDMIEEMTVLNMQLIKHDAVI